MVILREEIVLVLSILVLMIASCDGVNEYDYLQVVMQWQPATCNDKSKTYPYCREAPESRFSIHGMWPSLYNGRTECSGSPFDVNQISTLEPGLRETWRNVITGDNEWLWQHEWKDHGTCVEQILFDQLGYFSYAVDVLIDYNPEFILRNSGITPTDEVYTSMEEIYTAIRSKTGKLPALRCNFNYWTGLQQLHEISYCFNWVASSFVDCPLNANKCDQDYLVWYP